MSTTPFPHSNRRAPGRASPAGSARRGTRPATGEAREAAALARSAKTEWLSACASLDPDEQAGACPGLGALRGDVAARILYQPGLVSALTTLFDQAWDSTCPLDAASGTEPAGRAPAGAERDLLATGATDEVAARRLGISLRTARRHIAILMSRLDAVSRFQAGAEAAKRGWLA